MKRLSHVLVALMLLSLSACSLQNPIEDFKLILNAEVFPVIGSVRVIDGSTDAILRDTPITLSFSGPNADAVIDEAQESLQTITIDDLGFFTFGLLGVNPSPEQPAEVYVEVRAEGYLPATRNLIFGGDKHTTMDIVLVPLQNPVSGVTITQAEDVVSLQNGTMPRTVTLSTPTEPQSGGSATLELPEGVQLRDASGQPVSGALDVTMAYFSPSDPQAIRAFPGNLLNPPIVQQESGSPERSPLVTAGLTEITLSAGNQKVRTFSQPVDITLTLDPSVTNPETGQPLKAGDSAPIYSLNTETGVWVFEGRTEVEEVDGKLLAIHPATHLSSYTVVYTIDGIDICKSTTYNLVFPQGSSYHNYDVTLAFPSPFNYQSRASLPSSILTLPHIPALPATLTFTERRTNEDVHTENVNNLCEGGTIDLSGAPVPSSSITVNIDAEVTCPDETTIRPDGYVVSFWPANNPNAVSSFTVSNGQATISGLIEGETYVFSARIGGQLEQRTATIDPNVTPPDGVTIVQSGPGTYDVSVSFRDNQQKICP